MRILRANKSNIKLIITGCLEHNPTSEKRLFELYYGYVRSICVRYAKNNQETEEMLNDTFYTTFKYISKYDSSYEFKPWIRKVCVNCCLQYLKKHEVRFSLVDISSLEAADVPTEGIREVEGSVLLQLIKRLSPAYRMVFNLYVFEDYKHSEIAKILNISVGTSKSNLSKAKANLAILITEFRQSDKKKGRAYG